MVEVVDAAEADLVETDIDYFAGRLVVVEETGVEVVVVVVVVVEQTDSLEVEDVDEIEQTVVGIVERRVAGIEASASAEALTH